MDKLLQEVFTEIWGFIQYNWKNYISEKVLYLVFLVLSFIFRHLLWRGILRPLFMRICGNLQKFFDKLNFISPTLWFADCYDKLFEIKLKEKRDDKLLGLRKVVRETINQVEAYLVEQHNDKVNKWTNRIKFKI